MKSEEIKMIFKYYMEPIDRGNCWKMYSKYHPLKDIKSNSYAQCYDMALERLKLLNLM